MFSYLSPVGGLSLAYNDRTWSCNTTSKWHFCLLSTMFAIFCFVNTDLQLKIINITSMSKIEEIHQHVNKINEKIPLLQKEMVIIIGDTGEGKSSLLNYLAEVPMFSKEKEEGFVVCTESPLETVGGGRCKSHENNENIKKMKRQIKKHLDTALHE
ncbi:11098_t:CDS:2, partial [Entrophospora sp. SA101]